MADGLEEVGEVYARRSQAHAKRAEELLAEVDAGLSAIDASALGGVDAGSARYIRAKLDLAHEFGWAALTSAEAERNWGDERAERALGAMRRIQELAQRFTGPSPAEAGLVDYHAAIESIDTITRDHV